MKGQRSLPKEWLPWRLCLLAFGLLSMLSLMVPPMQSPDENAHLMRAEMLAQGQWTLQPAPEGTPTELSGLGGWVDKNLALFSFDFLSIATRQNRLAPADLQQQYKAVPWSETTVFYPAPGTGYYFPLIYAPQALALKAGRALGLGIAHSYQLARSFTLFAVCVLVTLAWRKAPPNPAVLVVTTLPMCIFQVVSPTLDGLTTALALLACSEFLSRLSTEQSKSSAPWLLYGCLFLVITSRTHLVPMLLLPLYLAWRHRARKAWAAWSMLVLACAAWILYALATTTDARVVREHTTGELLRIYLTHPLDFFCLIWSTLQHDGRLAFYSQSFIGILGWLDTPLKKIHYQAIGAGLTVATLISVNWHGNRSDYSQRVTMLVAGTTSVFIVFLALASTWTAYPATVIEGVQGRYFLVPAMLVCYALSGPNTGNFRHRAWVWPITLLTVVVSFGALALTLQERYHFLY